MAIASQRSPEELQTVPRPIVAWAGRYANGDEIPPHTHPRAQLLYAVEGVMRVLTPNSVWTIPSQRALWVPANVEHHSFMMSDLEMRTLYVSADAPIALGQECRAISVSGLLRELILGLIEEPAEYPMPGRGEHLTALILMEINRAATHAVEIPWPQDRRLQTVCHAIMNSPGVNRTIEELAAAAGASARTLIRLFPKETGLKYRQWVQQVQIAEAICRLGRGESIARISDALGYASPSAFSAMFKRTFGVAPNQYLQVSRPHPSPLPEGEGTNSGSSEMTPSASPNFFPKDEEVKSEHTKLAPEPHPPLGEDLGEGAVVEPAPAHMIELAKKLRKTQTNAEAFIWKLLRNRQITNAKFRRQHPIEGFVADFYCHECKLIIELDGGQHFTEEGLLKDAVRTQRLNELGIRVLRFDNRQAFLETGTVLQVIYDAVRTRSH